MWKCFSLVGGQHTFNLINMKILSVWADRKLQEWMWQLIKIFSVQYTVVVQLLSHIALFATPWTAAHQASPVLHHLPEPAQNQVHWVCDAIQPSSSLLSPSPPAFNVSQRLVFSNESVLHIRWPEYWNFSFSISPSNEYWGLISFRIDWLDLLAVQGILQSLLQKKKKKSSPTSQFKSINSLALSLIYSLALTSIHDCWKNHSFI